MKTIQEKINAIQAEILEIYDDFEKGKKMKIETKNRILDLVSQWAVLDDIINDKK